MSDQEFIKRYELLVRSLLNKTNAGRLEWAIDYGGEIECNLGSATVSLQLNEYDDGTEELTLRVRDSFGVIVDTVRQSDFIGHSTVSDLYTLFRAARRSATNAGEVLDGILERLEKDLD
ncbi:hypothetical protein KBY29_06740 [Ruegeria pomeroyi]|nr:hypothetical protein [Ruegeria pomeroyi]